MHSRHRSALAPTRARQRRRGLFVCAALAGGGALATAPAGAVVIGPGLVSSTNADSAGERTNIDGTAPQTLAAGTYDVTGFTFNATGDGNVVPFLATPSGDNQYQLLWIGSAVTGTNGTTASSNPIGHFTLPSGGQVFAGFYTAGGRVAFNDGVGNTDHHGAAAVPRGGVTLGPYSNNNLGRTYAFSVMAELAFQTHVGPGFLSNAGADTAGGRLNIDQANPRSFAPGVYDVSDFSFHGTTIAGEPAGNVTPFLARQTSDTSYEAVWVGGGIPATDGGVSIDPAGGFTLTSTETLYAGFFTNGNAGVAFTEGAGRPPGFGVTDHDNAFTAPTGPGSVISDFAFNNLERQYSFSVGATLVPEPGVASLGMAAGLLLLRRRASRRYR